MATRSYCAPPISKVEQEQSEGFRYFERLNEISKCGKDTGNTFSLNSFCVALLLIKLSLGLKENEYRWLHAVQCQSLTTGRKPIPKTPDPKVMRDQLLEDMVAGRDTTTCTHTWIVYIILEALKMVEIILGENE
ncbi:hypothetical protein OCU04_000071 [Sclerotinia nivalis]|uniref:Uncharacterized protein n=1 Tax=Sclerotinia nivalis TaxID=352851 RepID=A0A9X0AVB7_9HELO|nr:hypothetical protein OCU04_000071 [Sclerotinia nivalis]